LQIQRLDKPAQLKEQAYAQIKTAIMYLSLRPGEPLLERDLCADLGISRTPVREALLLLEREGWVASGERKGFVVAAISPSDVSEICTLRRANECLAVELALPNITPADIAHLEDLYVRQSAMLQAPREEFIRIDREFHEYLSWLSRHRRLATLLQNLSDHMIRLGIAAVTQEGRSELTLAEHRAILDALTSRDRTAAVSAMTAHLQNTQLAILASQLTP